MGLILFIVVLIHSPTLLPIRPVQQLIPDLQLSIDSSIVILTDPAITTISQTQPRRYSILGHFKKLLLVTVMQLNINSEQFTTEEHQATVALRGMSLLLKILQRIDFRSI